MQIQINTFSTGCVVKGNETSKERYSKEAIRISVWYLMYLGIEFLRYQQASKIMTQDLFLQVLSLLLLQNQPQVIILHRFLLLLPLLHLPTQVLPQVLLQNKILQVMQIELYVFFYSILISKRNVTAPSGPTQTTPGTTRGTLIL